MNRIRRPFWLPASNYYVLAFAIALAFFFVVWGALDDVDGMRAPWQTAGVSASIMLVGSVVLRAILLRRTQAYIRQPFRQRINDPHKLSIERAETILAEIRRKSEAASVLDKVPSGHREVYELCAAFVQRIDAELATVQAGSPRLAALLRSRNKASALHRSHTMRWAEVRARELSGDARNLSKPAERLRSAQEAIFVVEHALASYPAEEALIESRALLSELALSVRVANTVERAEHSAFHGDIAAAAELYREALRLLDDGAFQTADRKHATIMIGEAIDRLSFSANNR